MDAKKPNAPGWRISAISRRENTQICIWRKHKSKEEMVVVSGIDSTSGIDAYRIMVSVDNGEGPIGLRAPNDHEAREVLEDFGMLDAKEQPEMEVMPGTTRGFFKFIQQEASV
jgi:hypothetical protein